MSIGYFTNDLVATQQLGDSRQSWTLDPKHRLRAYTTEANIAGTWTNAASKLNHYGDDSDEPRWTIEDTTLGSLTHNISGPDGDLAATTTATGEVRLQLTNLHGDVAMTIDTALTSPEAYLHDEYGLPAPGQNNPRYGWLGGKQRSAETLGGLLLMGARLYNPALGRFLQTDPEPGGNANPYDYCAADPVNCTDLDGRWGWRSFKKALTRVAVVASYASMIPGPIGTIAGVVPAISYAATGNWKEAAWAVAGAAAAAVGAGAAVKGIRVAVTAYKAGKWATVGARLNRARSAISNTARGFGRRVAGGTAWGAGKAAYGARYIRRGYETKIGKNCRIAPTGNRVGKWYNRLPHYHRRGVGPGQGIGRHRHGKAAGTTRAGGTASSGWGHRMRHNPINDKDIPVLVFDRNDDAWAFPSYRAAAEWMEPVDVVDGEYQAYDSAGYVLTLQVIDDRVLLRQTSEQAYDEARERLRATMRAQPVAPSETLNGMIQRLLELNARPRLWRRLPQAIMRRLRGSG